MSIDLEKIDMIRSRLDVSYKQAKSALEQANGDVLEAIIILEESREEDWMEQLQKRGEEVVEQFKKYVEKGNSTKIKVKQGEKVLFEVPATVGALGLLGALASTQLAVVAGVGTVAALANKVTLELDKHKGEGANNYNEEALGDFDEKVLNKEGPQFN